MSMRCHRDGESSLVAMEPSFALKHGFLAVVQFAFLLSVVCFLHVFKVRFHTSQFIGHLGPGGFLVGLGAFELTTLQHSRNALYSARIQYLEGRAAMVGTLLYVLGSSWYRSDSAFSFNLHFLTYSLREQQHIAIMAVIFMSGLLAVRLSNGQCANQQLPAVIFSISFGFFIAQHKQPNIYGYYMHWATCAFVVMHALARVRGNRLSAAVFVFLAGYSFFYGQSGIIVYIDDHEATNPTAFLLGSLSFALVWVLIHTIAFPVDNEMEDSNDIVEGDEESTCLVGNHRPVLKDTPERVDVLTNIKRYRRSQHFSKVFRSCLLRQVASFVIGGVNHGKGLVSYHRYY